jgi:RNase adaptor protein for sRNA GlmZ degradation
MSAVQPGGHTERAAARVQIESFGYGFGPAPRAHLVVDVRDHFRDPHVNPELRELTARDERVVRAVLGTPGVPALVRSIVLAVGSFLAGPSGGPVVVAIGCVGGRHRAPVIAADVTQMLEYAYIRVDLTHRDMGRAVIGPRRRLMDAWEADARRGPWSVDEAAAAEMRAAADRLDAAEASDGSGS